MGINDKGAVTEGVPFDLQENEHQMFFGGCLGDIGGPSLGDLGTGAFPDIAETSFSFGCFS